MHSQLVIVDVESFSKLIEKIHTCPEGLQSKLDKICMVSDANIRFKCCNLQLPIDNLQIKSSNGEVHSFNTLNYKEDSRKDLQYEEVIFIDDIKEPDSFESVFVDIEENQSSQSKLTNYCSETDPLLVDQSVPQQEPASFLKRKISSNLFKVSAKNFLPKVVDWSSESIENVANEVAKGKKTKYPSVLICEFCGLQFDGKDRVYKFFYHRNQTHTQSTKYTCPVCQRVYWGERELSAHVVCHLSKEHICEVCGVTFQRKNELLRHFLTHKKKEFSCKYCSKLFRRRDHLNIHERIHTKTSPYECQKCGSAFPQKHQLNLHHKKCVPTLKNITL